MDEMNYNEMTNEELIAHIEELHDRYDNSRVKELLDIIDRMSDDLDMLRSKRGHKNRIRDLEGKLAYKQDQLNKAREKVRYLSGTNELQKDSIERGVKEELEMMIQIQRIRIESLLEQNLILVNTKEPIVDERYEKGIEALRDKNKFLKEKSAYQSSRIEELEIEKKSLLTEIANLKEELEEERSYYEYNELEELF